MRRKDGGKQQAPQNKQQTCARKNEGRRKHDTQRESEEKEEIAIGGSCAEQALRGKYCGAAKKQRATENAFFAVISLGD